MGNKWTQPSSISSTEASIATVEVDEPSIPGGLSRREAWEIALAWRNELQGCVRLETDVEPGGLDIVDSFQWITFVFNGSLEYGLKTVENVEETAAAARVATIAWFALSCCPGYTVHENPRFWRRIFTELYYPQFPRPGIVLLNPYPERPQKPITEAIPFFPNREKPFPRIRVVPKTNHEVTCIRTILGAPAQCTNTHSTKLDEILARLQPYMCTSHWCCHTIPVAVESVSAVSLSAYFHRGLLGHQTLEEAVDHPNLQLSTVFLGANDLRHPEHIQEVINRAAVTAVVPYWDASHEFRRSDRRIDLLFTNNDQRGHFRISTIDYLRPVNGPHRSFQAIVSALPYSQAITRFRISSQPPESRRPVDTEPLTASDWAWLGYAVFHPDTSKLSSLTELDLDLSGVPVENITAFAKMANGNNLLVESNASPSDTTYMVGKVRAGTIVLSESQDGADMLWTCPSESPVTLCSEATTLNHWVHVVVPGVGLGWIRSHSLVEVNSVQPGISCVRKLRLKICSPTDNDASLVRMLTAVGFDLQYLEIQDSKLMESATVRSALRLCPSLMSLSVSHDGSCWANKKVERNTSQFPQLQQLELKTAGYNDRLELQALNSSYLDNLRVLRVVTAPQMDFSSNRRAFLAVLGRYSLLHYAHHTNGQEAKPTWEFRSYDERRTQMLAILGKIQHGVHDVSQGPMRLDCRLAFLSAIRHHATTGITRWSAIQAFGSDIVRNILSFSTSPIPRDIFVDQRS